MLTRDIYWTGKLYAHKVKKSLEVFYAEIEENNCSEPLAPIQDVPMVVEDEEPQEVQAQDEDAEEEDTVITKRLPRSVAALQSYNNPGRKEALFCFHVKDPNDEDLMTYKEPITFKDAWYHPDEDQRTKWRESI